MHLLRCKTKLRHQFRLLRNNYYEKQRNGNWNLLLQSVLDRLLTDRYHFFETYTDIWSQILSEYQLIISVGQYYRASLIIVSSNSHIDWYSNDQISTDNISGSMYQSISSQYDNLLTFPKSLIFWCNFLLKVLSTYNCQYLISGFCLFIKWLWLFCFQRHSRFQAYFASKLIITLRSHMLP